MIFTNVNYPATYDDIATFEQNNNESVFVYAVTEKDTVVLSRQGNYENYNKNNGNRINLLLISNGDANHYVYIKDVSRLFYSSATHAKCKVADKCLCPYCNKFFDVNGFQKHY